MDAATRRLAEMKVSAHPDAGLTNRQITQLHGTLVKERARKVLELERHMQEALGETAVMPDETDMAQRSTEQAYLIRFADKERKLLNEIDRALEKLRVGDYGVCEGTEEPIGFKRLELRPWTRYSVSYKEQIERERSQHRR
ncbi:MAG: TraR/DksA C4-type zinc finger protein [Sandaracinaceae bacterium]